MVHLGLSTATQTPELALSEGDAKSLAAPLTDVLEEFNFQVDPRYAKVFALIVAAGSVYGPRAAMIALRLKGEHAKSAGRSSTVTAAPAPAPLRPADPPPAPPSSAPAGGDQLSFAALAMMAADNLERFAE